MLAFGGAAGLRYESVVTTCTWNFRRHAPGVLTAACLVVAVSGVAVPRASADQISDLQAQAKALAARIQNLGFQEEAFSEQYDSDVLNVQTLEGKVAQASRQLAQTSAHEARSKGVLKADAVQAYVHGGANPLTASNNPLTASNNPLSSDTNDLLRAEYVNSLATDESDAIDEYHLAALQDQAAKTQLQQETAAAQTAVRQVSRARQAASEVSAQLQGTLNQDKGRIAVLVAQQQAAAAAAAAAAERARLAAAAAAQQAAQQAQAAAAAQQAQATAAANGGQRAATELAAPSAPASAAAPAAAPATGSAPPTFSGAGGVVAAAESRVGDAYVWGAAGPSSFDCSGLVMWAYAQVGISLPHFSGAQYADTTHIPMSDLQPGDLVFFANPGQHVAIYIGGGRIVEAADPAIGVHITALYPEFVLASRVE
jgi:peptidoglycan DL-endopeptidase CwlO